MDLPLRNDLAGALPYGAPQVQAEALLNVNENPYPPPAEVIDAISDHVREAATGLNRYPDRDATALRADLAQYVARESDAPGLTADNVWAANGSNEVMMHIHQAFGGPGRTVVAASPTYSMYPEYARESFTHLVHVQRREDFGLDMDALLSAIEHETPTLVVLASPNNPSGNAAASHELEAVCAAAANVPGGCVVVVDEAYAEFRRPGVPSFVTRVRDYPHVIVTRTMSKAFALAGARLGYAVASPAVIDALRIVRLPYHLSAVTQATARAALHHSEALLSQVGKIRQERDNTVTYLRGRGYTVVDSDANFVLFGPHRDRERLFHELLERGVLIRVVGPPGWLRVTIGTSQEMALFRKAWEEITA